MNILCTCRNQVARWGDGVQAEELYDHRDLRCNSPWGFDLCEDVNYAGTPGLEQLKEGLRDALKEYVQTHNLAHWTKVKEHLKYSKVKRAHGA